MWLSCLMESTLWSSIGEKCNSNKLYLPPVLLHHFLFLFFCSNTPNLSQVKWRQQRGGASYILSDTLPPTGAHHVFTPSPTPKPHCQPPPRANFIDGTILHKTGGAPIFFFFSLGWKRLSALIATPLFSPISPTAAVEASGESIIIKVEIADWPMKDWLNAARSAVRWTDWTGLDRRKHWRFFIIG